MNFRPFLRAISGGPALFVLGLALSVCLSFPASASESGKLERLLENLLSSPGISVDITGLQGALSSRARLERLTISDQDGAWLVLEDARLDWTRSALFRKRLEVQELTASRLAVLRWPGQARDHRGSARNEPDPPDATGTTKTLLPELPVEIEIGRLAVGRLEIGREIAGDRLLLALRGTAQMKDGGGRAELSVRRTDGPGGLLSFTAGYDPQTDRLDLEAILKEEAGGIVTTRLDLPGHPALDVSLRGAGPLSHFTAEGRITSAGTEMISSTVSLSRIPDGIGFEAMLSGNPAGLLSERLRPVLGQALSGTLAGDWTPQTGFRLDRIDLSARSLRVSGQAGFDPAGWPDRLSLRIAIADPEGNSLALPGLAARIGQATLDLDHDRTLGKTWTATAYLERFSHDAVQIESAEIEGHGTIDPDRGVTARFAIDGVPRFRNRDVAQTLGRGVSAIADLSWAGDASLLLHDVMVETSTLRAGLNGRLDLLFEQRDIQGTGSAALEFLDLSALPLAGIESGRASATLGGSGRIRAGSFDIDAAIFTEDVSAGAFDLLGGSGQGQVTLSRDGTTLRGRALHLDMSSGTVDGSFSIGPDRSRAGLRLSLPDLRVLSPHLEGGLDARLAMGRVATGTWQVTLDGAGPADSAFHIRGETDPGFKTAALDIDGSLPLPLLNRAIAPRSADGRMRIDLALEGPLEMTSLSGEVALEDASLALPELRARLDRLQGGARIADGKALLRITAEEAAGGRARLSGPLVLSTPWIADLQIRLRDGTLREPGLFRAATDADITLKGPLAGGAEIAGTILFREGHLQIPESIGWAAGQIDGLEHRNLSENVQKSRARAGLRDTQAPDPRLALPYGLDVTVAGPARLFIRGRGLDAELGGKVHFGGTSADPVPGGAFELIRGRMSLLGRNFTLTEGTARMEGDFDPYIHFRAETRTEGGLVTIGLEGKSSAPDLILTTEQGLPEDEALSLLLFDRGIGQISAMQAVRLGLAIRTLTSGDEGIMGKMRRKLGLDDLELGFEDGAGQARLGKYMGENAYSSVTLGTDGQTRVEVNLDLGLGVTARGEVASDGETEIGLVYEREY